MSVSMADNRRLFVKLALFSTLMFGFGYALVPFYSVFCAVTGLNKIGLTDLPANTQVDASRSISIEFDSNVHDLPWQFRPLQSHVEVHPGEVTKIMYEVINTRNVPVTGQAIPSYGPKRVAEYFRKLECFCFEKQTLAAGERRQMPVVFVIDAALPKDIGTITLSYTFFEVEGNRSAEVPVRRNGA